MRTNEIFMAIKTDFPEARQEEETGAVIIPKESLLKITQYLKNHRLAFDNLHCITAIDRAERVELAYTLYSISEHHGITLKIYLTAGEENVASLAELWKSANWLEREVYDLFGVIFLNHPDLRRILNPYDWKGHPLRKSYSHPEVSIKPRL
ncbi:MAG: hypothetical protein A3I73_01515 [Omnitrophica bacterium RIFCSPLOWO2_02_FULL_45_16]|nr:MAG: hypothetical protein A3C51_05250 [Omnitrophica bacterium RIFCSPHIGHO2_02_FULL_46_20]OGW93037.1 MAG: hypothetical protein A3K16_03995 [Omnitrophica bacterium RIFCSPLOWO2_01_FULL_45_24]OGX00092.1 MAG: hypothetical protein A3I73_01515 [Omnitrophica bacterium RIFCSPLOWO2_02_FULL_45_16]